MSYYLFSREIPGFILRIKVKSFSHCENIKRASDSDVTYSKTKENVIKKKFTWTMSNN